MQKQKQDPGIHKYWKESSYQAKVKCRFIEQVEEITKRYNVENLVLVVDMQSAAIVTTLFKVAELVAKRITFIENITKQRKKLEYHALYFISPTPENIDRLIKDFSDKAGPQYRKIHLLFTTYLDRESLKRIAAEKYLLKRIAKNSIKEFYHSMRIVEKNTLSMHIDYMSWAYSRDTEDELWRRVMIGKKLVQILANIGELNSVKIYYKIQQNNISQRVVQQFSKAAKEYLGTLVANKSSVVNKYTSDVTFMFLDRSVDPVTPLLHNFTYEALLFDLMKVSYERKEQLSDKECYSFEQFLNSIYQQFRFRHISEALEKLPKQAEKLKEKIERAKDSSEVDYQELNERMKDLKRHSDLITIIWNLFQQKHIDVVGQLEQSLATGITKDAKNTSSSELYEKAIALMSQAYITPTEKLRLGVLLVACLKLSKKDYQSLLNLYDEQDKKAIKNIIAMGITYDSNVGKTTKAINQNQQNIAIKRMKDTRMPLNRYTSIIELVIPMALDVLCNKTQQIGLDPEIFASQEVSLFPNEEPKFDIQKFVLFMVGGLSYGEISALRTIKATENIILVTDQMLDPRTYAQNLKKIDIL